MIERGIRGGEGEGGVKDGVGFNRFLCLKTIWIGGQIGIQFQMSGGHG